MEKSIVKQCNNKGFKPGVSGNPAGRPPVDKALSDCLRIVVNKNNKALAEKLVKLALHGSVRAFELIFERMEGKVMDAMQERNDYKSPLAEELARIADAMQSKGELHAG